MMLLKAPTLRKLDNKCGRPIIFTVDTSPTGIGWAIGQDDEDGHGYAVCFGAKILLTRQRDYPQVKTKLWGIVLALKCDKEYFIGASVIVRLIIYLCLG